METTNLGSLSDECLALGLCTHSQQLSEAASLPKTGLGTNPCLRAIQPPFLVIRAVLNLDSLFQCGPQIKPSVGHSHKFCAIIAPAHLAVRTDCWLKVIWLGWCPSPMTASLTQFQKMNSSGSVSFISRSPRQGQPCRFQGVSIVLDLPIPSQIPSNFSHFSSIPPPTPNPAHSHLYPQPVHLQNLLNFPFPRRSMCPLLNCLCCLVSLGLWIVA